MTDKKATLIIDGKEYSLPIMEGTMGQPVIDINRLGTEAECFTFDIGFKGTASCTSTITYIDGDKGILLYRGYPIEQLAEKSSFLEVAYLLLKGELPQLAAFNEFKHDIWMHSMVHEQLRSFFNGFRRDAHPMAVMCGVIGHYLLFIMMLWILAIRLIDHYQLLG